MFRWSTRTVLLRPVSPKNNSQLRLFFWRFFTCPATTHPQFFSQKIIAAGDYFLVKLASGILLMKHIQEYIHLVKSGQCGGISGSVPTLELHTLRTYIIRVHLSKYWYVYVWINDVCMLIWISVLQTFFAWLGSGHFGRCDRCRVVGWRRLEKLGRQWLSTGWPAVTLWVAIPGAMPGKAPKPLHWRPPLHGGGSMSATYPMADSHQTRVNDGRTGE